MGIAVGTGFAGSAEARGTRHAAMVMDANTGAILYNDDGDERRHPASLTKMMTLYLAFESIEAGRLSMSSMVGISEEAAGAAPSKLDLDPGEQISVGDAVRALITKSANDVAAALAEKIGGTHRNFVRLMNDKARALGMSKTNFENASGLPDRDQVTTARDMITLALHLQDDFPEHYKLFSTRVFNYNGRSYRNHNTLMKSYAGIDGVKTGYTRASGFNVVTSLRRNGRHVVAAVFGGKSAATRNGEMRVLLTRYLSKASRVKTRQPKPVFIAKLKSEPKRASRQKPKPPPAAVAQVSPPPAASKVSSQPAPAHAWAVAPASAPAPISVAKVRRIMVAHRRGPRAAETTDMPSRAGAGIAETIVPKTTPGLATTYKVASAPPRQEASMLGGQELQSQELRETDVMPHPIVPPVTASVSQEATAPVPAPETGADMRRGKPPSTLQAQASALHTDGNAHPRVASLDARDGSRTVAAPAGRFEIQVGAYANVADAQRALKNVQVRTGSLLVNYASVTQPVDKAGRLIYRARFRGFDSTTAVATCQKLRTQSFDCFVMSAE